VNCAQERTDRRAQELVLGNKPACAALFCTSRPESARSRIGTRITVGAASERHLLRPLASRQSRGTGHQAARHPGPNSLPCGRPPRAICLGRSEALASSSPRTLTRTAGGLSTIRRSTHRRTRRIMTSYSAIRFQPRAVLSPTRLGGALPPQGRSGGPRPDPVPDPLADFRLICGEVGANKTWSPRAGVAGLDRSRHTMIYAIRAASPQARGRPLVEPSIAEEHRIVDPVLAHLARMTGSKRRRAHVAWRGGAWEQQPGLSRRADAILKGGVRWRDT